MDARSNEIGVDKRGKTLCQANSFHNKVKKTIKSRIAKRAEAATTTSHTIATNLQISSYIDNV